jgi:hypothetical protein
LRRGETIQIKALQNRRSNSNKNECKSACRTLAIFEQARWRSFVILATLR